MVAAACKRVLDRQIIKTWTISTSRCLQQGPGPCDGLKEEGLNKNINVIMIILMLKLLEWSPAIPGFGFWQFAERVLRKEFCKKSFAERVCGKSQVGCGLCNSTMLIEQQVRRNNLQSLQNEFCRKSQKMVGPNFPILMGLQRNSLLLQQEGVRGPPHHHRQDHAHL